jgi:hypothetical protein
MSFIPFTTPVSKIIRDYIFSGTWEENSLEELEISETDFNNAVYDVEQRLKVKIKNGKVSSVLVQQLARHKMQIFERFGNEFHQYHFSSLLDMLELVDKGRKMNVRNFNNKPLAGLKHIHHDSDTFIAKNMENYWKGKVGTNDELEFQNKLLNDIYSKLLTDYDSDVANKKTITVLLTTLLYECKFRSPKKQTGEWIVFGQKDNVNYYLCLATHQEAKDFTDSVIFDRLKPCLTEFPILEQILIQ